MKYRSEKDFLSSLDDYILFYNSQRPHSNNNYKTPDAKEEDYFNQKETPCSD
jgi:transposase InsO family protein